MQSIRFLVLLLLCTALLSACGLFKRSSDRDYLNSTTADEFKVPDGLQQPAQTHEFDIPAKKIALEKDPAKLDALEQPPAFDTKGLDDEGLADAATVANSEALNVREARNTEGYNLLVVEAKFDTAWDSVGNALKQMGFTVEDSNRGEGIYAIYQTINRVMTDEEKFLRPRDDKGLREEYQVHLEDRENLTRITVRDKSGKVDDSGLAKHLLAQLRYELEHPKSKQ